MAALSGNYTNLMKEYSYTQGSSIYENRPYKIIYPILNTSGTTSFIDNNIIFDPGTTGSVDTSPNKITFNNINLCGNTIQVNTNNLIPQGTVYINQDPTSNNVIEFTTNTAINLNFDNCFFNNGIFYKELPKKRKVTVPTILNHHGLLPRAVNNDTNFGSVRENELVALQLLRSMVNQEDFKRYLKYGFVTAKGDSGLIYQIIRNKHHMKVWKQGTLLCELCIYLKDTNIPPTDAVVSKMLIVECDELDIWKRANIYWKGALQEFHSIKSKDFQQSHLRLVA